MQAEFRAVGSVSAAGGPFVKSNHRSGAGGGSRRSRLIQAVVSRSANQLRQLGETSLALFKHSAVARAL
jgi:hypothetical protein